MIKFLDLYHQYQTIQTEFDAAIRNTIEKSAFIGGESVKSFESAFAHYQQALHCVGVANGTDELEIAIEALNLPAGSDVIVPANSFIASSEAVTRYGHRVVFADIGPTSYNLVCADVERRITHRTKAVIAVHLFGHQCDMDGLRALATTHNLKIVEYCAQAHGAEYKGQRVGTIGNIGVFSFYPGKNLGAAGDASAILTNDEDMAVRCRMIANHGRIDKYNHLMEGRNSRLDGLQAAVLNVKLRHLDGWIGRRKAIAGRYLKGLSGVRHKLLPTIADDVRHALHLFVVRLPEYDGLKSYLSGRGIESGIHYPIALPKLAAYAYLGQAEERMLANSSDTELLRLPMGEHLSDAEVDVVISAVRGFAARI